MKQSVGSLLHPTYGSAAADVRSAVGASPAARAARLGRQLDAVQRALVLRARAFRGIVITQDGTRITPDHQRWIEIDCPDGSIVWEQGDDTHQLVGCVDVGAIAGAIGDALLASPEFMDAVCTYCNSPEPQIQGDEGDTCVHNRFYERAPN